MLRPKLVKWYRSVFGKSLENHLETLTSTGSDFIQRTHFVLLERVFRQIVEVTFTIDNVLPVPNHAKIAKLRENPVPFLKRIFAATQTGDEGQAVKNCTFRYGYPGNIQKRRIQIREVDQVS